MVIVCHDGLAGRKECMVVLLGLASFIFSLAAVDPLRLSQEFSSESGFR